MVNMIELSDVTKAYRVRTGSTVNALQSVSLTVVPGEFVMVVGRSGSGKSTLLNLIAGLTAPSSGNVSVCGEDLWQLNDAKRSSLRNRQIGFVFQFPSLIQSLDITENILLPAMFSHRKEEPKDRDKELAEILDRLEISDKSHALPRHLSAGQQQRAVIARALFQHPDILLADEPTSNLDAQTEQEIVALLTQLNRELSLTIMMVTHTDELALAGSRKIRLDQGKITSDEYIRGGKYDGEAR